MAQILIRGLDDDVKKRLKVRAAQNDRSLEAEVREVLEESLRRVDDPIAYIRRAVKRREAAEPNLPAPSYQHSAVDFA